MARQQAGSTSGTSRGGGRDQGQGSEQTRSGAGASSGSQSGVQSAGQRSDQERQREVTREGGGSGGMQRGGGRQATGAVSGRGAGQPSLLPALMASPDLMASAFMSNPFAFAQAMSQEMDRLFSDFGYGGASESFGQGLGGRGGRELTTSGGQRGLQQGGGRQSQWHPQMELFQRGNELVLQADLPGLKPEDVQIDIEDGVLTVSGERRQSNEEQREGYYRTERSYGSFSRSIALPEGVDENQVQARFEHGVLEVTVPLPQQQQQRGRRIQIQSGAGQSAGQSAGLQSGGAQTGSQSGSQSAGQGAGQSGAQGTDRSRSTSSERGGERTSR